MVFKKFELSTHMQVLLDAYVLASMRYVKPAITTEVCLENVGGRQGRKIDIIVFCVFLYQRTPSMEDVLLLRSRVAEIQNEIRQRGQTPTQRGSVMEAQEEEDYPLLSTSLKARV